MDFLDIGNCDPSWRDEVETRDWRNYPELSEIPSLGNSGQTQEALASVDNAIVKFSDLDFPYCWKIILLCKDGALSAAASTLEEGLKCSKLKSSICTCFASKSFNAGGNIVDSLHWWIVSASLQFNSGRFIDDDPFLHLASVANVLSENSAASSFLQINDQIYGRGVRFHPEKDAKIQTAVLQLPVPAREKVRSVILSLLAPMNAKYKVSTVESAKCYDGIGLSSQQIGEIPAGTMLDVVSLRKQDRKRWIGVTLAYQKRMVWMSGETKVSFSNRVTTLADVYAQVTPWQKTERQGAAAEIGKGLGYIGGGVLGLFFFFFNSDSPLFPIAALICCVLGIKGAFHVFMGCIEFVHAKRSV